MNISAAGIKINHADSHHHIHTGVFIAPIAARVCREKGIDKMRLHRNAGNISFVKRIVKNKYNKLQLSYKLSTPAYYRLSLPDILPEIDRIKSCMKEYGAEGALMTGSGSAIFGIFEEKSDADDCMNELERHFENVWLTEPVSECQVIK